MGIADSRTAIEGFTISLYQPPAGRSEPMLLSSRFYRFLLLLFCAAGFLNAQDERPHLRLSSSPAIHDKTIFSEIHFYGDNELARQEHSQFEELYKSSCECDDAVKELAERVRYLYQQHGYFKTEVQGTSHSLNTGADHPRVSVDIEIKQGLKYRLGRIEFTGQKAFSAEQLRPIFAVRSGDVFNVERIREGLENLRKVYGERGYINVTPVPDTKPDDTYAVVDLSIDIHEGAQFRIGTISFSGEAGSDSNFQERVLKSLGLKPGDVYDPRLLEAFFKASHSWLPVGSTVENSLEIAQNTPRGTVDLYFVFEER
jgi:outer membrane protein assembly factor BamA